MKIIRKMCAVVLVMICAYVLGCVGFYCIPELNPNLEVTTCISPSMEPVIMTNGLLITDTSFPFKDIEVGDIILFEAGIGRYVNHRVHQVGVTDEGKAVMTVGDSNMMVDAWVTTEDEYIGKVVFNTNIFEPIISLLCGDIVEDSTARKVVGTGIALIVVIGLVVIVFWDKIRKIKIRRKSI